MKKNFAIGTALAAAALAGTLSAPARADLTINGAVGLPLNPTARMPLPGGARIQANYFDLGTRFNSDAKFYGLYAATALGERVEISGGVEKLKATNLLNGLDRTGVALGIKYLLYKPEDLTKVRVAIGAQYSRALVRKKSVYIVGTKYLGNGDGSRVPIAAHLGVRYDRFDNDFDTSNQASLYGGVEVPLTADNKFSVVGELQTKNQKDGKFPYAASIRYQPQGTGFSASIGIARQGLLNDNGLFAQIGYSFDRKSGDETSDNE